jgi:hypothetical protein
MCRSELYYMRKEMKASRVFFVYLFFLLAGASNGVMDSIADSPNYNKTNLSKAYPRSGFEYGTFIGCKCDTWVNKWKELDGEIVVGYPRFVLSESVFVGLTDLWHFSQFLMLLFIKLAVLFYRRPDRFLWSLVDFAALTALWGLGFTLIRFVI